MKYFGTDGIRQKADQFTPEFINSIVIGLSDYAETLNLDHTPRVFIAGDTRESSEWILQDVATALESLGFEYSSADILPTPAINYCFYEMGFDFAIDSTASHNPYVDNGIKIFERGDRFGFNYGIKLSEKGCEFVENAIASGKTLIPAAVSDRANIHDEAVELYVKHLVDYVSVGETPIDLSGLHLGVDCANGAMSAVYDQAFKNLNISIDPINADPHYGQSINANCGSTHPEKLQELVSKNHLDFGVAFDGDGDRCLLVDETGELVDGDQIIALLSTFLKLDSAAVTVMSNQGIFDWATKNGKTLEVTAVGDSNVAAAMREKNIPIGGEQSGHVILPGQATGDGLLTALMVTKAVHESKKTLRELASVMTKFPQVNLTLDADANQKSALASSDAVKTILAHFTEKVKSINGRLLVRPSGTENLIRITVWGDDETKVSTLAEELKTALAEVL